MDFMPDIVANERANINAPRAAPDISIGESVIARAGIVVCLPSIGCCIVH